MCPVATEKGRVQVKEKSTSWCCTSLIACWRCEDEEQEVFNLIKEGCLNVRPKRGSLRMWPGHYEGSLSSGNLNQHLLLYDQGVFQQSLGNRTI